MPLAEANLPPPLLPSTEPPPGRAQLGLPRWTAMLNDVFTLPAGVVPSETQGHELRALASNPVILPERSDRDRGANDHARDHIGQHRSLAAHDAGPSRAERALVRRRNEV